jgi:hypothetical protein
LALRPKNPKKWVPGHVVENSATTSFALKTSSYLTGKHVEGIYPMDKLLLLQGLSGLTKLMISCAAVFVCGAFLVFLWQEPSTKSATADSKVPPFAGPVVNQNVTSHGQSGGITAHTVNSDAARK